MDDQRAFRGPLRLLVELVLALLLLTIAAAPSGEAPKHVKAAASERVCAHDTRPKGTPCHIVIDEIGVDATVISLGLTRDGRLEVPTNFAQAGWWSGGPKPGDVGPAVIVGHVDSVAGPAVFYRLRQLGIGDRVTVFRIGESPVTFQVIDTAEYPKTAFPTDLVYGDIPYPGLRLITCGGAFNHATGHYVDNVIVFLRIVRA